MQDDRRVLSVNVGRARPLAAAGWTVLSGIDKQPVDGPVAVGPLGLAGDEQADPSVHGGLAKAVYAYPVEHQAFWVTVRAQAGLAGWNDALAPGALGENLTLAGLLERDAYVGDVLRFPGCALAVSEPRMPCFKFAAHIGLAHGPKLMVQSGWCGFYLAVREPGTIAAGDPYELLPGRREVSIAELFASRAGRRHAR